MANTKPTEGRVVRPFMNVLENNKLYTVGDTFKGTATQITNMVKRGYVAIVEDAPVPEKVEEQPAEAPAEEQPAEDAEGVSIEDIKPKTRRRRTTKKATEEE